MARPRSLVSRYRAGPVAGRRSLASVLAIVAVVLLVAGCSSSSSSTSTDAKAPPPTSPHAETETQTTPRDDDAAPPTPNPSRAEQLIQAWLAALEVGDYKRAGSYFARGALVDQGQPMRLATRADAITFNRLLPCRAHLNDVRRERRTTLATFLLSDGPGGTCTGSVRVRFTIRDGRFTVFRQLLDDPNAPSVSA